VINRIGALFLLVFISPIILILCLLIIIFDGLPIFFIQKRIGKNNSTFLLYKFRSMKNNFDDIPTHMVKNPGSQLSRMGPFLRRYSFDELSQLVNIIKGDMNFIGPRPALYNQKDLILLRAEKKIDQLKPGVTGWAQVNGRDQLSIPEKVNMDKYYLDNKSVLLDTKIIFMTIKQLLFPKGISH